MDSCELALLLVEDDLRLARFTGEYLEQNGVAVTHVVDGPEAVRTARGRSFDAVLLDLMLPQRDGLWVCREIRRHSDVPIVMMTARHDESDRVAGLELGADDYVTKPFSARELLARVRSNVRRARGEAGPAAPMIRVGGLEISPSAMRVTRDGAPIVLTGYEFALLRVLAERRGRVLTREQLMELAKGSVDESFDRSIDVRISRLRQKLGERADGGSLIRTIRGHGYVMVQDEEP